MSSSLKKWALAGSGIDTLIAIASFVVDTPSRA